MRASGRTAVSAALLWLVAAVAVRATMRAGIPSTVFVHDPVHGNVRMGIKSEFCDNGETHLELDWDGSDDSNFTCTPSRRQAFEAESEARAAAAKPEFHLSEPAKPLHHRCTSQAISYDKRLPTSGPHRPLWPVWGRYIYVPAQRWLHSLEHGGIVGLYHPCAPAEQVEAFADAIAGCLRRHVIAADGVRLRPDRPFALLAYRNKVLMANFDRDTVESFILSHALRGPERTPREGQYSLGLVTPASNVTDYQDSILCPGRVNRTQLHW
ncbi:hypothetical protein BOX15_Mlig002400g1 [Macrostomum lignano]|uniref:DUF3105 domain-containing protein n=2 Tax=Macrostomum lignano TaxID=282301 RepID=A0A1I8G740_9PLAT|nr:hypothetical protein BOX15_Mlig002400g1 [Macrostomum lignano]